MGWASQPLRHQEICPNIAEKFTAMKNKWILFLLLSLLMGACRSLQFADYTSKTSLQERLPRLNLMVHEPSFLSAYDEEYLRRKLADDADEWYGYQITDRAADDVFTLLRRDLDDNIASPTAETYGNARFKLLHYNRPWRGIGWIVPSIGTMFIANLFGMPAAIIRVEMELQMELTDANGNVLIRYVAPGAGKTPQAFYYGYDGADGVRRSNLLALKDAMKNIKQKMAADVPMLTEKLLAAGPIPKIGK